MSKGKIIGVVALLLAAYFYATPYITVHQMKSAAESRNGEALSEYIDFPSVRQSLKDQMNALFMKELGKDENMKDNPFAALGAAFAGVMVDKMVDASITPAGITQMMAGEKPSPKLGKDADEPAEGTTLAKPFHNTKSSYESLSKFVVRVNANTSDEGKFVLRRDGIGWKLTEIILPLGS